MISGNAGQMFQDRMALGPFPQTGGFEGSLHVDQVIIDHHNAHVTNTNKQLAAVNQKISDQSVKIQTLDSGQRNTEAALKTEIANLTKRLETATSRLDTQKSESETKINQLETKLQTLALSYLEIVEQLTRLTSRFNESNSFFGSSRAPTEVGDDDDKSLND